MKKRPFGFLVGLCVILIFYFTVGLVASHLILSAIAAQTRNTVSIFDTWWQTTMFVLDILTFLGLGYLIVSQILAKKRSALHGN